MYCMYVLYTRDPVSPIIQQCINTLLIIMTMRDFRLPADINSLPGLGFEQEVSPHLAGTSSIISSIYRVYLQNLT